MRLWLSATSALFALDIHPLITFVLLVATITFMVLGWYRFSNNVLLSCMAWAVAIVAVLGLFGKRFPPLVREELRQTARYKKGARWFSHHKITSFITVVVSWDFLVWLMAYTFGPRAQRVYRSIFAMVDMPAGSSQERTGQVLDKLDSICATIPGIEYAR